MVLRSHLPYIFQTGYKWLNTYLSRLIATFILSLFLPFQDTAEKQAINMPVISTRKLPVFLWVYYLLQLSHHLILKEKIEFISCLQERLC